MRPSSCGRPLFAPASSAADAAYQRYAITAILRTGLHTLCHAAPTLRDPLAAELLGSAAASPWWGPQRETGTSGEAFERRVGWAYATALLGRGDAIALAALRALQLGGSDGISAAAARAADRLAGTGVEAPAWWPVAPLRYRRAARVDGIDGGRSHLLALEVGRGTGRWTLGMLVLDAHAGVAGDLRIFPGSHPLRSLLDRESAPDLSGLQVRQAIDVSVARTAMRRAIGQADRFGTPKDGHGYVALRGLAQRWIAAGETPDRQR